MANLPQEFSVDVVGELTGEAFKGVFKAKPRLTHNDRLLRDQIRRDLLGPKPEEASAEAKNIAFVLSKIWVHLTEVPSWWKDSRNGRDLEDEVPVAAVFEAIEKLELESLAAVQKKGEKAAEVLAEAKK